MAGRDMIRKAAADVRGSVSLTPMMQQYFAAKDKHPNDVLFFRMGDFYEMFFDDAEQCAEVLGIALTSRSKDKSGASIPMAGIPVRSVDGYIAKLLRAGKRVAICEQVQDPKDAKGIVDREVVRVITPGTVTDESLLEERNNNYLAALFHDAKKGYGLSWLDLTTGQFLAWETENISNLAAEIGRLAPAEIVLPESIAFDLENRRELGDAVGESFQTPYPDPLFDYKTGYRALTDHFQTKSLDGFGCEHLHMGVRAAGALLRYLQDTQKVALRHITLIQAFQDKQILPIDRATQRALELTETSRGGTRVGTLLHSFDRTSTALGGRLLREWLLTPLTHVDAIVRRQEGVAELVDHAPLRENLAQLLKQVHDLERIAARISYGSANARDLLSLGRSLRIIPEIKAHLADRNSAILQQNGEALEAHEDLAGRLVSAIDQEPPLTVKEGDIFAPGFHAELDELRQIANEGKQWLAKFQQRESERTNIPLKIGFNKVFGYYVEVTNSHKEKVPDDYIRKQTLKNCERYITPELKEYEGKVLHAKDRANDLEYELFCALRDEASSHISALQATAAALARVDVLSTFARLAEERGYVRPLVDNSMALVIEDGRHPVVEDVASTEPFIANSVDLDSDRNIMMITGPNMAGKSTYIRQVALLTLLAQTGSFIPARKATIGVIDRLFTRVGASDDLTRGQSTFMVEMHETANILNNASDRSLIILDEVGRGTSTFDGVSLAWAITEHVAENLQARTLFATHYHELTALKRNYPMVANYNFAVKEWNDEIIFLRKVIEGGADKSYGIHVARLAGIPKEVIDRAKEILSNLESQSLDIDDQPSLAKSSRAPTPGRSKTDSADPGAVQLDMFRSANDDLLKDLKRIDPNHLTPIDALNLLIDFKNRVV